MPNIIRGEMKNQNHGETQHHIHWLELKSQVITSAGEDAGKLEPSSTEGGIVKCKCELLLWSQAVDE